MLLLPIHGFQFFSRISHGNNPFTYICEVQIVFFIWNKFDMSVFILGYYGLQGWCHFHSSEKRFFWPNFLRFRDYCKKSRSSDENKPAKQRVLDTMLIMVCGWILPRKICNLISIHSCWKSFFCRRSCFHELRLNC